MPAHSEGGRDAAWREQDTCEQNTRKDGLMKKPTTAGINQTWPYIIFYCSLTVAGTDGLETLKKETTPLVSFFLPTRRRPSPVSVSHSPAWHSFEPFKIGCCGQRELFQGLNQAVT